MDLNKRVDELLTERTSEPSDTGTSNTLMADIRQELGLAPANELVRPNIIATEEVEDKEITQGGLAQGFSHMWGGIGNALLAPEHIDRLVGGSDEGVRDVFDTSPTLKDVGRAITLGALAGLEPARRAAGKWALERSRELEQFAANHKAEGLAGQVYQGAMAAPGMVASYLPYALGGPWSVIAGMGVGEVVVELDKISQLSEVPQYAARGLMEGMVFKYLGALEDSAKAIGGGIGFGTGSSIGWSGQTDEFLSGDWENVDFREHVAAGVTVGTIQGIAPGIREANFSIQEGRAKAATRKQGIIDAQNAKHDEAVKPVFEEYHKGYDKYNALIDEQLKENERGLDQLETVMGSLPGARNYLNKLSDMFDSALDSVQRHAKMEPREEIRVREAYDFALSEMPAPGKSTFSRWLAKNKKAIDEMESMFPGEMPDILTQRANRQVRSDIEGLEQITGQEYAKPSPRPAAGAGFGNKYTPDERAMLNQEYSTLLNERTKLMAKGAQARHLTNHLMEVEDSWNWVYKKADEMGVDAHYLWNKTFPNLTMERFNLDFDVTLKEIENGHTYAARDMSVLMPEVGAAKSLATIDSMIEKQMEVLNNSRSRKKDLEVAQSKIKALEGQKKQVEARAEMIKGNPSLQAMVFRFLDEPDPANPSQPKAEPLFSDIPALDKSTYTKMVTSFAREAGRSLITGKGYAKMTENPIIAYGTERITRVGQQIDRMAQELLWGQRSRLQTDYTDSVDTGFLASQRTVSDAGGLSRIKQMNADDAAKVLGFIYQEDYRGQMAGAGDDAANSMGSTRARAQQYGLTDDQYRAFTDARTMMHEVHDLFADTVRTLRPDLPQHIPQPLYMFRRHLNARQKIFVERYLPGEDVNKKAGTNVFTYPVSSHADIPGAKKNIQAALNKLDDGYTYKLVVSEPRDPVKASGLSTHNIEAVIKQLQDASNDKAAEAVHKIMIDEAGIDVHHMQRKPQYVGGFAGDPNQAKFGVVKSNEKLLDEFTQAAQEYVYSVMTIAERAKLERQLQPLFDPSMDFVKHYKNSVEFLQAYKRNAFGEQNQFTAWTDKAVGTVFGNNNAIRNFMKHLGTYTLRAKLGTLGFISAMTLQPAQIGLSKLAEAKYKYGHNGDITYAVGKAIDEIGSLSPESKKALIWASRMGILEPNFVHDFNSGLDLVAGQETRVKAGGVSGFKGLTKKQKAAYVGDKLYRGATLTPALERMEGLTRSIAYLQNYYFMRSAGMNPNRALKEAAALTNDVMVEYVRSEKMPVFQEYFAGGTQNPTGTLYLNKNASMFKTFAGNWIGHLATYTADAYRSGAIPNKRWAPLAIFAATNIFAGGLGAMVGAGIWDATFAQLPGLPSTTQIFAELNDEGEYKWPTAISHGVPSAVTGIDLSGTLGMPGLDPTHDLISAPGISLAAGGVQTVWSAYNYARGKGEAKDTLVALKKVVPNQYHGWLDAAYLKAFREGNADKIFGGGYTEGVLTRFNAPTRAGGKYDPVRREASDWLTLLLSGKRSVREARLIEGAVAYAQAMSSARDERQALVNVGAEHLLKYSEMPGWVQTHPDWRSLEEAIALRAYKHTMTEHTRIMQEINDPNSPAAKYAPMYLKEQ